MKEKRPLTVTRMFGRFPSERIDQTVQAFSEFTSTHGPVLIISHVAYPHRDKLASSVVTSQETGNDVKVVFSRAQNLNGRVDHATMLNLGIITCAQKGLDYFATVSSDFATHIPSTLPLVIDRLNQNPSIATVGVAVDSIHDAQLLEQIRQQGPSVITHENFGSLLPSNTFSTHRVQPLIDGMPIPLRDRMFQQLDETTLGSSDVSGITIPLWGHEGVALPLRLLGNKQPVDLVLLAGSASIKRNRTLEVATHQHKTASRQPVATGYQRYYGITDAEMDAYLQEHFAIEFVTGESRYDDGMVTLQEAA